MKRRGLVVAVTLCAPAIAWFAGSGVADPMDPHMPYLEDGYCADKLHPNDLEYRSSNCAGTPYPDGTYWTYFRSTVDSSDPGKLTCVIPDLTRFPPAAPPGGCGGTWQG